MKGSNKITKPGVIKRHKLGRVHSASEVYDYSVKQTQEDINKGLNKKIEEVAQSATEVISKDATELKDMQYGKFYFDEDNEKMYIPLEDLSQESPAGTKYKVLEIASNGIYINDNTSGNTVKEKLTPTYTEYNNTAIKRNDDLISYTPQQLTAFLLAENGDEAWSTGTIPNTPRLDRSGENGSGLVYTFGRNIYNTTTQVYRDSYIQYIIGFNGIYVRTGDTIDNVWSNAAPVTKVTDWGTNHTTAVLPANAKYVWGEVSSLTLTFADEVEGFVNHYYFQFDSGSTPTTLSLPSGIKWNHNDVLVVEANKRYQISIEGGIANYCCVSLT